MRTPPRPVVKRTARAIVLETDPNDPDGPASLVLIRRTRPGAPHPYWITPGGGVERSDRTVVEALHREVDEELGGKVVDVVPAFVDTISHTLPSLRPGTPPTTAACSTRTGSRCSTSSSAGSPRWTSTAGTGPRWTSPTATTRWCGSRSPARA